MSMPARTSSAVDYAEKGAVASVAMSFSRLAELLSGYDVKVEEPPVVSAC
jgi:hypothetical protein